MEGVQHRGNRGCMKGRRRVGRLHAEWRMAADKALPRKGVEKPFRIHATSKQTHGTRCKRPFPSRRRRLRIEQRLNGCGRNRNEKGKKARKGGNGRPANVFAHRTE